MKLKLSKQKNGFTIIEVMIVLAIAGLILAIVFLAVPSLQRNARNNSRRNDVSHLIGLVNEYEANNNGQLPTAIGTATGNLNITSESWAIMNTPATADIIKSATNIGGAGSTDTPNYGSLSAMKINEGFLCNGNPVALTITNGSSHTFAIGFQVETSGAATNTCVPG